MAEGAVGCARRVRADPDLGPRYARRRRGRDARWVCRIAGRRPVRRAGAARRDADGRLAAGAGRDRGAGRADDDRAGPCRRPYRARADGTLARPGAARAVRPQCRPHRRPRSRGTAPRRWRWSRPTGLRDQPRHQPCRRAARHGVVRRRRSRRGARRSPARQDRLVQLRRRGAGAADGRRARKHPRTVGAIRRSTASQFGRPIAKFQAVQHNLATLAGEVAAAGAAADAAAEAIALTASATRSASAEVAIAKVRGRRGGRHRRRDRPSGAWRDGLYLRALAAPCDAAAVGVARGVRQRGALGRRASAGWSRRAAPTRCGPSSRDLRASS